MSASGMLGMLLRVTVHMISLGMCIGVPFGFAQVLCIPTNEALTFIPSALLRQGAPRLSFTCRLMCLSHALLCVPGDVVIWVPGDVETSACFRYLRFARTPSVGHFPSNTSANPE